MRDGWKSIGACLGALALVAAAGCGSSDTKPGAVKAAIGSKGGSTAGQGGQTKPARPDGNTLHPKLLIETSLGSITVQLDAEKAPLTVDNFLAYVDQGYYDQTVFHQVVKGYVILGGGYTTNLVEKKTRTPVRNEAHNGLKNRRGTIAMARQADAIDSATSQFFFNLSDNPLLDHKDRTPEGYGYCVFGEVTEGQNVLEKIAEVEVRNTDQFEQIPVQTVMINSIRRIR